MLSGHRSCKNTHRIRLHKQVKDGANSTFVSDISISMVGHKGPSFSQTVGERETLNDK